jgi:hypothetical protein
MLCWGPVQLAHVVRQVVLSGALEDALNRCVQGPLLMHCLEQNSITRFDHYSSSTFRIIPHLQAQQAARASSTCCLESSEQS